MREKSGNLPSPSSRRVSEEYVLFVTGAVSV